MGYLAYKVKVPQLMQHLQERQLLKIHGQKKSPAQYLIGVTSVAPNTAYQAVDEDGADTISMDSLWKIYVGLREAGITVIEDGQERPVQFEGDVYEEVEVE